MAIFEDRLTSEGRKALARMLAGEIKIKFTRMAVGDGELEEGTEINGLAGLIHTKASKQIEYVTISKENIVTIAAIFRNIDITDAFFYREKGIFAEVDDREILFLYANNGEKAEWIEPSRSVLIEKLIRSILIFAENDNLNIEITSGIYLTVDSIQESEINGNFKVNEREIKVYRLEEEGPEFTEAESLENIESGEKISSVLGKIKKAIYELINHIRNYNNPHKVSFENISGALPINKGGTGGTTVAEAQANLGLRVANNDQTTAEGYVADARIVKIHGDEIDDINRRLNTNGGFSVLPLDKNQMTGSSRCIYSVKNKHVSFKLFVAGGLSITNEYYNNIFPWPSEITPADSYYTNAMDLEFNPILAYVCPEGILLKSNTSNRLTSLILDTEFDIR